MTVASQVTSFYALGVGTLNAPEEELKGSEAQTGQTLGLSLPCTCLHRRVTH